MRLTSDYETRIRELLIEKESLLLDKTTWEITLKTMSLREKDRLNQIRLEYEEKLRIQEENLKLSLQSRENKDKESEKRYSDKLLIIKTEHQTILQSYELRLKSLEQEKDLLAKKLLDLEEGHRKVLIERDRSIEELRVQIARIPGERDSIRQEFDRDKQGFINEISLLKNQVNNESQRYITLEGRLKGLGEENQGKIAGFELRINELLQERKVLESELSRLRVIITQYERDLEVLRRGKEGSDGSIEGFKSEIRRLEGRIKDLVEDYEEKMRKKGMEMESSLKRAYSERDGLRGDLEELKRRFEEGRVNYEKLRGEYDVLNERFIASERKVMLLEEINQKYEDLMAKYTVLNNDFNRAKEKIGEYEIKINGLLLISKNYDELLVKYNEVVAELAASKEKLMFYENKIAMLSGEVNRMKNLISGKTNESDDMKRRIEDYEISIANFQKQLGNYELEIRELRDRNQSFLINIVMNCAEIDSLRGRYVEKV